MRYPFNATFGRFGMPIEDTLTVDKFRKQITGVIIKADLFDMFHHGEFPNSVAKQARKADVKTVELPPEALELPFEFQIEDPDIISFYDGVMCKVGDDIVPVERSPAYWLLIAEMTSNCAVVGSGIVKTLLEKGDNPEKYSEVVIPLLNRVFTVHRDRDQAKVIAEVISRRLREPKPKTITLAHIGGTAHIDLDYFLKDWAGDRIKITHHQDPRYTFQFGPIQELVVGRVTREEALGCIGPLTYANVEALRKAYISHEIDPHINYTKFVTLLQKFDAKELAKTTAEENRFQLAHPEIYSRPRHSVIRVPIG